ncbi:hypothetical protein GCM10020000_81680 [Streptomyces olivoverticillatus]
MNQPIDSRNRLADDLDAVASTQLTGLDPELEAAIPAFPRADLSDPVAARDSLARLAATAPAPDATGLEIEERTVDASPQVPVRIYRPREARGAILWLHGGGFVMGDLSTEHPWAVRVAQGSGAVVISVGYRRAPPSTPIPPPWTTPTPRSSGRRGTPANSAST